MKIALIQINPHIGNFSANITKIISWASKARAAGCQLAVFPELAVSGYPPQDLLERPQFLADHQRALQKLIDSISGIAILCGAVSRHTAPTGKRLHNSAILFNDGEIIFAAHKQLLPTYDVFDEARYFEPASGNKIYPFKGLNLAITICEDIWNDIDAAPRQIYNLDPVAALEENAGGKIDLMINIAASPFRLATNTAKHDMLSTITRKYKQPLIYINQVGGQDSLLFDGGSMIVGADGQVIAQAARYQEDMLVYDTEAPANAAALPAPNPAEDVLNALTMGVKDYVGKCGFDKVLIGLSGGIDSALTAALAVRALGPDKVMGVALPSPYSSKESVEDARQLAVNLDIHFEVVPINDIFEQYLSTLAPLFADRNTDVTEQNIQARIRGNLLMAISNKFGCMLLSTGNKSEMAVGYCTLYGDMSGGLAVISDVPKEMVYKLSRLINEPQEIIPQRSIDKPPSAELAPDQLDQDDLPPYDILDPILAAYLEDNKGIDDIIAMGYAPEIVKDVIRRVKINEYKRKQAPLGLKVTSKAFGYGRRYPNAEHYQEGA